MWKLWYMFLGAVALMVIFFLWIVYLGIRDQIRERRRDRLHEIIDWRISNFWLEEIKKEIKGKKK